jgi:membrane-bound lytic murein transglycosylase B
MYEIFVVVVFVVGFFAPALRCGFAFALASFGTTRPIATKQQRIASVRRKGNRWSVITNDRNASWEPLPFCMVSTPFSGSVAMRSPKRTRSLRLAIWVLVGVLSSSSAIAAEKVTLPEHAVWVVDETDPAALANAFSAPHDSTSGPLHQLAIHAITLDPSLREPTLALITDATRKALATRELDAAKQLRTLTKAQANLPAWKLVAPASVTELKDAYLAAQKESGIEWQYLAAVNFVETKFGRIRGVSTAGARGPMQFLPSTWKIYGRGGDIENVRDAIAAAGRFLKAKGGPANMAKALYRYNNSKPYVDAVTTYAKNMKQDPTLLSDYHGWQVIFRWASGDVILETGYAGA